MLLYVIRHADPIYDPDTLTEKGKAQAKALARRLAVHGLDRIFSSPNGRARETAQPTCELLGIDAVIEPWTSEDYAWPGLIFQRADGSSSWVFQQQNTVLREGNLWMTDRWDESECICGGGRMPAGDASARQTYERIQRDSDAFLERLGYRHEGHRYRILTPSDERIAVFCHQGFGTTWLSQLLDIPPLLFWSSFDITHSGITILHFQNYSDGWTAPKCLCLSDTSHLYEAGLPLQFNNVLDL